MRVLIVAASLALSAGSAWASPASFTNSFDWPQPDTNVIPDVRLAPIVQEAREAARSAVARAREGRQLAAHAPTAGQAARLFGQGTASLYHRGGNGHDRDDL